MATLKSLVDETTNIKNELKTCHTNLKNNLSAKGVSISSNDKLSDLVGKINSIVSTDKVIAGTSIELFKFKSARQINLTTDGAFNYISKVNGSVKLRVDKISSWQSYASSIKIELIRKSTTISTKQFSLGAYGAYIDIDYDIVNVQVDDIISIIANNSANAVINNGGIIISCDKL